MTRFKGGVMETRFLTPAELVERYGGQITLKTLSNWRGAKSGPSYIKVGCRVLYPMDDVLAWEKTRVISGSVSKATA